MEPSFLNALLEYGAMGIFAAFLVWQHISMQKRLDKLVEKFQAQLEGIQGKSEVSEDKLRHRYDAVIKQYQDDKAALYTGVSGKVEESMRMVEKLEKKLSAVQIHLEGLSLEQRNAQAITAEGVEILKKMQEEQRLKEMARKLKESDV